MAGSGSDAAEPERVLAALYDAGADAYERYWAPVLHRHARALVAALPPEPGRTVLDIGGGVGTLSPLLRGGAGSSGRVIVLDRSHSMLTRAPTALTRVQADAARLPIADAAADVVVFAFVLFLLPNAHAAIAEAARVLPTGGWLLAATWGQQHATTADDVVAEELDRAGAPPCPPLPRSDELTNSPARMAALLEAANLTAVRTERGLLNARLDPDSVLALRTRFGTLGWRYAHLATPARGVGRRIATRLAALAPEAFHDRSEVLLTWARRT